MSCFLSAMRTEGGGDVCGGDDGAESDARRVADYGRRFGTGVLDAPRAVALLAAFGAAL
jgi:hypothetical protein